MKNWGNHLKNLGKLIFLIFCLVFTIGCKGKQGVLSSSSMTSADQDVETNSEQPSNTDNNQNNQDGQSDGENNQGDNSAGVCDKSVANRCQGGHSQDQEDTETHYLWQCVGSDSTDDCSVAKLLPVNGSCNESQNNGCHEGSTLQDQTDTETHYVWQCAGSNGGTTDDCSMAKPLPVNGSCDQTKNNGCLEGSLQDGEESQTHYLWQCRGSNGGNTDECSIAKSLSLAVNGSCDESKNNGCHEGSTLQDQTNTETHYVWQCTGSNGGTTDDCSMAKPVSVNGSCNASKNNQCLSGVIQDQTDTKTHYLWQCVGSNGGTIDDCSIEYKRVVDASLSVEQVATSSSQDKLDILMVIDNSSSMEEHQENLGTGFGSLVSSDIQAIDWQMAFINTDDGKKVDGDAGEFYYLENETGEIELDGDKIKILSPQLQTDYNLQNIFINTVNRYEKERGSITEKPLTTIIQALNSTDTTNQEFFRSDSTLAVVVLSNEDEDEEYSQTRSSHVIEAVQNKFGTSKNFITYGIILKDDPQCKVMHEGARVGKHINKLVEDTGGITGCITDEDYSPIVTAISNNIETHLSLQKVDLPYPNVIEKSIEITFDPVENAVGWEFDSKNNQITFPDGAPTGGTNLDISFSYYSEVSN